jgi:DNA-binding NarL/FixJ family response regulator
VIVEDHPAVRDALAQLLAGAGLRVAGVASHAEVAFSLILRRRPQVAVIDLRLGRESGLELTQRLVERVPELRVLLYTGEPVLANVVQRLLASGAAGLALKSSEATELTDAIHRVAAGETYIDPALRRPAGLCPESRAALLSEREREILRLVGDGNSSGAIAELLFLSPHTVRTHIRNAMGKLGVHSRAEAVLVLERAERLIHAPGS